MKILRIVVDPIINGRPLSRIYRANIEKLHEEVLKILSEISDEHMYVNKTDEISFIPKKQDGYVYSSSEYLGVLNNKISPHMPDEVSYEEFINHFNLISRRNAGEFDEVHVWGAPFMGFYESRMIGNKSIRCNSPPYRARCENFIIMGFSYERLVSEALEAFGHRTEDIVKKTYPRMYRVFEKCVGSIHKPFNTNKDYDWGNKTYTKCKASMFPNYMFYTFSLSSEELNCNQWGCTGEEYLKWWFEHLPKYTWGTNLRVGSIGAK